MWNDYSILVSIVTVVIITCTYWEVDIYSGLHNDRDGE